MNSRIARVRASLSSMCRIGLSKSHASSPSGLKNAASDSPRFPRSLAFLSLFD